MMNRKPQSQFGPMSTRARVVCGTVAIVATLAMLNVIEALAHGYGPIFANSAPVVIAQR